MTMNATTAVTCWKSNAQVCPPADKIAHAIQDREKQVSTKQKGIQVVKHKYPIVEQLAMKMYTQIYASFHGPDSLSKNTSYEKTPLVHKIMLSRKNVDVTEQDPLFLTYSLDGKKVYLVKNCPKYCGVDEALERFQTYVEWQLKAKVTS